MKQSIVVLTGDDRDKWLNNFESTLPKSKYPLRIVKSDNFELGAITEVMNDYDEFIFLHDTCEIKSDKLFSFCFEECGGRSVSFANHPSPFGMYLGKYRSEILKRISWRLPETKLEAVEGEISFPNDYARVEYPISIPNSLTSSNVFEEKFGRLNMILENDWIKKYKATWNRNMI